MTVAELSAVLAYLDPSAEVYTDQGNNVVGAEMTDEGYVLINTNPWERA
jgi:hypothetical protein